MAIWTEYTTKNVPEDEDTLMIYDSSGGENKQLPVSGMSEKIVNDVLQKELDIKTENKTIPSAVNELHGYIEELVDGTKQVGDAVKVNGHTVNSDVPENAVFTDTVYNDLELKQSIADIESGTRTVGNSAKVNNHTVNSDVPENAVFTDTVYDDTKVREDISQLKGDLNKEVENRTNAISNEQNIRAQAVTEEKERAIARENEIEQLFSAPTEEAVAKWLDEHPEATTTVQDGSLEIDKFTNNAKLYVMNDYVTPQMYGAVGDGVNDDTDAFEQAIEATNFSLYNKNALFLPKGTYKITRNLTFNRTYIYGNKNAIIQCENGCGLIFTNAWETFVSGITIQGDGTGTSLTLNKCSQFYFEKVNVSGFEIGIDLIDTDITHILRPSIQECGIGLRGKNIVSVEFEYGNWYNNRYDISLNGFNSDIHFKNNYFENSGDCFYIDTTLENSNMSHMVFENNMIARNSTRSSATEWCDEAFFFKVVGSSTNAFRWNNIIFDKNRFYFYNDVTYIFNIDMSNIETYYCYILFSNNIIESVNDNIVKVFNSTNNNYNKIVVKDLFNYLPTNVTLDTNDVKTITVIDTSNINIFDKMGGYKLVIGEQFTSTADEYGRVITNVPYYSETSNVNIPLAVYVSDRAGWLYTFGFQTTVSDNYFVKAVSSTNGAVATGSFTAAIVYLTK